MKRKSSSPPSASFPTPTSTTGPTLTAAFTVTHSDDGRRISHNIVLPVDPDVPLSASIARFHHAINSQLSAILNNDSSGNAALDPELEEPDSE
ncbi:hypothetical protein HDU84_000171 [Entophlyctis sp. JEL0112]|nr:hypothetical protein HDU84_000171 [Entophlyctis sp. JEL0112]